MKFFFVIKSIYLIFSSFFISVLRNPKFVTNIPNEIYQFIKSLIFFKKQNINKKSIYIRPIFFQKNMESKYDAHYVIQSWWCTKKIKLNLPDLHHDISSNIGFVVQLSAIVDVHFIEYNLPKINLPGIKISKGDIQKLPFKNSSLKSLSCLHVLEHIGLGRYGDKIDFFGMQRACGELSKKLKLNGNLYISFPVGIERIEFNAQRVSNPKSILKYFPYLELKEFSLIDDNGTYFENANFQYASQQNFGCGLFHFVKQKL